MPDWAKWAIVIAALVVGVGWMAVAARTLQQSRATLIQAEKQLLLYRTLMGQMTEEADIKRNREQVALSLEIFRNVAAAYNDCLKKPGFRFPAWVLGYRPVGKKEGACVDV